MQYPFNAVFQRKALKFLIETKPFDLVEALKPEHFDEWEGKQVILFLREQAALGRFPTLEIIRAQCGGIFLEAQEMSTQKQKILTFLDEIVGMEIEYEEVQILLVSFVKSQKYRKLLLSMNEDFAVGDLKYSAYTKDLMEITDFDVNQSDGIMYSTSEDDFVSLIKPMPTHLKTLNAWLDGGLDIGEFGLVMGQTGIGKTFWLCNIAAATYMFGGKVFYYTFELGDAQIKRRIDGRISGFTFEERKEKTGKLKARLEREAAHGGEIVIKHFPAKEVGVPGIIGHINKMKVKHNLTPDLILIDYIDLVKPFVATGDDWKELGDIANALHGQIAQKMGTRVWSVSQIKTESFYQRFDLRAIRRSAEKINIADVVLAISQSQEDEKNDTMMVELLKLRRGHRARGTFKVKLDYARGTMTELIAPLDDAPVTGERMGVIS